MPASPIYRVALEHFEGPLDLLLFLIQRDEVDVYDIPIAHITDQYLQFLDAMQSLDLDIAGEFILMAATLMAIKSRLLLPALAVDEEGEIVDPRAELVRQLVEYRRFRAAAEHLGRLRGERRGVCGRGSAAALPESPEPELEVGLFSLLAAYRHALDQASVRAAARPRIAVEPVRIEDRVRMIRLWIGRRPRLRLSELLVEAKSRLEVIVTFMAILELVRLGEIGVRQPELFSDLYLLRKGEMNG
jgi:segregation and condensation protein A